MSDHYIDSRTPWMRQSAKTGDRSEPRAESERSGLEDSERTSKNAAAWPTLACVFALFCSASLVSGCVSDSFQVREPLVGAPPTVTFAPEVLLEVDDAGVKWGSGKVGDALRTAWLRNQVFRQVHYPIYPSHKVPVKLRVVASGNIESEAAPGMIKAFFTGLLLFLPVGVIQYEDIFSISALVSVHRDDRSFGPLNVNSSVEADHILFANPESYAKRASDLVLEDFANRISRALSQHPEWFSQ